MKAPDKIYVGLTNSEFGGVVYDTVSATFPNAKEYIRKEALLEWANEQIKVAKANNLAYSPFEKLIDKLNEM